MPKDIRITYDKISLFEGDFTFDSLLQDFESDEGLETAVLISLFTDRRANNDDVLPDPESEDKRGWWGDLVSPFVEGDQIGSRLWLLERSKTESLVIEKAKQYTKEALQWMIDDGTAVKINVEVERQTKKNTDIIAIKIEIYKTYGGVSNFNYDLQWNAQFHFDISPLPEEEETYYLIDDSGNFLVDDLDNNLIFDH